MGVISLFYVNTVEGYPYVYMVGIHNHDVGGRSINELNASNMKVISAKADIMDLCSSSSKKGSRDLRESVEGDDLRNKGSDVDNDEDSDGRIRNQARVSVCGASRCAGEAEE